MYCYSFKVMLIPLPDSNSKRQRNVIFGKTKEFITCLLNMNINRIPILASYRYIRKSHYKEPDNRTSVF
jgi:hypothetical protein